MKKLSIQNKKYLLSKSKKGSLLKNKRVDKVYLKGITSQVGFQQRFDVNNRPYFEDLKAPSIFNLQYENCNNVIKYINSIKEVAEKGKNINILMDGIDEIGEGAIAMLLSVIAEINENILIRGIKPKPGISRDILEKSGFFNYMDGHIHKKNRNTKNTILKTSGFNYGGTINLPLEIRNANETVWKESGRNPPLRAVVFEMIRNSCDHAFINQNNIIWHLGISHDDDLNQVKFSFVDNGRGIIKSLSERKLQKVLNLFKDNVDLLDSAFRDGIRSRTGISWRGKGLPTIFENYQDGYFKNLIVISNDVFIDFEKNLSMKLEEPFNGTYYFWSLDTDCKKACYN